MLLREIRDDQTDLELDQVLEHPIALTRDLPRRVTELGRDRQPVQPLTDTGEIRTAGFARLEPRGKLENHAPEHPRVDQRLDGGLEVVEQHIGRLDGDFSPALARDRAAVAGSSLVQRQPTECDDVELEPGRRVRGPFGDSLGLRDACEGVVRLHHGRRLRIEAEHLPGLRAGRIEIRQSLPRTDSKPSLAHGDSRRTSSGRSAADRMRSSSRRYSRSRQRSTRAKPIP